MTLFAMIRSMNLIEVIPISKQRGLDRLSYFSNQDLELGIIVEAPIRSRTVKAMVVSSKPLSQQKSNLRGANYSLKELPKQSINKFLPKQLIVALGEVADHYASDIGTVIKICFPKFDMLLDKSKAISDRSIKKQNQPLFWQFRINEFESQVDRLLRSKKNTNIAIITADQNQQNAISICLDNLDPTIITGKTKQNKLNDCLDDSLVIFSRSYGPLACLLFDTVIYVNSGGDSWRDKQWPFFHWDVVGKTIAQETNVKMYDYSNCLDSTTWHKYTINSREKNNYVQDNYKDNKISIIQRSTGHKNEIDTIFDRDIQNLLKNIITNKNKALLYVTRKGLFPVLVCQDCSHTTYTKAYKEQIQRYQIASTVSDWVDPTIAQEWVDRCENCGSWRLSPVAISLEQVKSGLHKLLGSLDSVAVVDTVEQNHKQSLDTIKKFESDENIKILLTTKRSIYNLNRPVDYSIIVSIDAALSSSSLNVETDIIRMMYYLDSLTNIKTIIQTRLENNPVLSAIDTGKIRQWQNKTLQERQALRFPPFSVQIKLSLPVNQDLPHQTELKKLLRQLGAEFSTLPSLNNQTKLVIMTIESDDWNSTRTDPIKNYLNSISLKYPAIINPDILL